jgi:hypothetical protein
MEYFGRIGRVLDDDDSRTKPCSKDVIKNIIGYIKDVSAFVSGFRAPATDLALLELSHACKQKDVTEQEVALLSNQVFERFNAEVRGQWLVILSHEHSDYLNDEIAIFGENVRDKFPKLTEDIDEAAKCLALSRYTASVFHLMRVMESTVHLLAKKVKVSIDLRSANWNDITTTMSNYLSVMPGKTSHNKRKKQIMGEAIANLNAVRIAWRNEVMHPKRTYTKKEAELIFNHVEGFLNSIVPIL